MPVVCRHALDARTDESVAKHKGQPRPATVQGGAFFMNTTETVLIVGASTRAAAFSALRAGLMPRCVDYFADRDLMAICTVDRVESREGVAGLERLALGLPPGPWLYTGPLENHPDRVERISRTHRLCGNAAETLRGARDPFRLVEVLRKQGLPYLETRPDARGFPATEAGWSNRSPRQEAVSSSTWITRRYPSPSRATFSNSSMAPATQRCSSLSKAAC